MTVVTRFAPSPTGELHIGGARTALFNWLYSKHMGGKFLLRIEDTDKIRSLQIHTDEILEKLKWLGLDWDDNIVYQSKNSARHSEIAHELLKNGHAYYCYATEQDLKDMKEHQQLNKLPYKYDGRWRDKDPNLAPAGVPPVIRLKMPQHGKTTIVDRVQGSVTVDNSTLDDMILLRADGTSTYMLAVVVDDYDMGVTHIIRGDDHLNNAFRQIQIYNAMGWKAPEYAHIPLIHGEDGKKESKRDGAKGIGFYKDLGYLPEALRNYLLRLGWGNADNELLSTDEAIKLFDLPGIVRSPARLDMKKLNHINSYYMRDMPWNDVFEMVLPHIEKSINRRVTSIELGRIVKGLDSVRLRSNTIIELAKNLEFYVNPPTTDIVIDSVALTHAIAALELCKEGWHHDIFEPVLRNYCTKNDLKFKDIVQVTRLVITGSNISPSMFEIFENFGYDETMTRLKAAV